VSEEAFGNLSAAEALELLGIPPTVPLPLVADLGALSYVGNGLKVVRVDAAATGWEFMATAALTDGDKGDIVVSSTGSVWTIDAAAVSLAKMADVATATVFYRKTAGAGAPEVQTLATLKTDLGLTGTNSGDQTSIVGIAGTKAQFDTACSDGNFFYAGDVDTDATLAANSDSKVASQKATKTYVDQIIAAQDAMVFKGVIDCSANPNYPAADRGHTYRVSVAGKIGGASGANVEVGDLLLCLTDGTSAGNQATVGSSWSIAQTNMDGGVIGPSSATDNGFVRWDGTSGKLVKNGAASVSISSEVSGLGSNVATFLATPSSANLIAAVTDETGAGALVFGTSPTLATPVINGLPTGTGVASAATASTLVARDANGNIAVNNLVEGFTTTATAAGTTTLTIAATFTQVFTGSTTQTVKLPTTSVLQGQQYLIVNQSTGAVTVQSSGANTIVILAAGTSALLTAVVATPTTAANWSALYAGVNAASGKVATVSNSLTLAGTDGTTITFPSGGITFGSIASQAANAVAITGGTAAFTSGAGVTPMSATGPAGRIIIDNAGGGSNYIDAGITYLRTFAGSEYCRTDSNGIAPLSTTTASAANVYQSGSGTVLLRSTSSMDYKRDIEDVDPVHADAILSLRPVWYRSKAGADNPEWGWWGLIAEEVARIDPRLVHWAYRDEDYYSTWRRQKVGKDADGKPIFLPIETRRLRKRAKLRPEGVQYERLSVLLLSVAQRQQAQFDSQEARISALEARFPTPL
jgi:hypothetical protein